MNHDTYTIARRLARRHPEYEALPFKAQMAVAFEVCKSAQAPVDYPKRAHRFVRFDPAAETYVEERRYGFSGGEDFARGT